MESYSFTITYRDGRSETRNLNAGRWTIGREMGAIVLGDPNVSTTHGALTTGQGAVSYTDLGSSNGSFTLKGERIGVPIALRPGDGIRLGNCTLTFVSMVGGGGTQLMPQVGAPDGIPAPPPEVGTMPPSQRSAAAQAQAAGYGAPNPGFGQPAPGYGGAPAPGFGQPAAPQPGFAQPGGMAPGQPGFGQPAQPGFGQPPQPGFAAPGVSPQPAGPGFPQAAAGFAAGAQPNFGAPPQAAPGQPGFMPAPGAPGYGAPPGQPGFAPAPGAPAFGAPPAPGAILTGAYSHPDSPVRHSYPLNIRDAGVGTAFGLVMKTMPFLMVRFGILAGVTVLGIIWWALAIGGLIFLGSRSPIVGWAWLAILAAIAGFFWRAVLRYFLYLIKAAHIAVLTELITTGQVANGQEGMFGYGKRVVKDRFGQVNIMFALDLLIDGIVKAFNRTLDWITGLIPIPGLDSIVGVVKAILRASTTYIDETMFSYTLARGDQNVYRSSKDGLIYYAQNAKEVLKTGVWVVILDKVLTFIIWIVMLAPGFIIGLMLPNAWGGWATISAFIFAILFAADVRSAFLKPLFLTMVMVKFHASVQNQAINPEWDARLESASNKFKELKDKAVAWVSPSAQQQPAANPALPAE